MSILEEPKEYMKEPVVFKTEFGDYTAFYIAIGICTVFGAFLFLLNIVFCCCSKYKEYWKDSNTGNRWLVSIWTKTPHHQPPLDLTELEECYIPSKPIAAEYPQEYLELQKRESDL
ncbi:uncharacterized protein LOC126188314 [Schistocerca cancellata]|uniref:uncharacterized protein LOC126188314 n=1 Tax=Schistocerca cancellata TaxID=274614 RepID=UPI0021198033|nr:uncharacterized protein LOC126188314 [Schistocerca cancellata]